MNAINRPLVRPLLALLRAAQRQTTCRVLGHQTPQKPGLARRYGICPRCGRIGVAEERFNHRGGLPSRTEERTSVQRQEQGQLHSGSTTKALRCALYARSAPLINRKHH